MDPLVRRPHPEESSGDRPTRLPQTCVEWNNRASGRTRAPSVTFPSPCSMACRETRSKQGRNAPTPSTDTTVRRGFHSVNICTMCHALTSRLRLQSVLIWCGGASSTCFWYLLGDGASDQSADKCPRSALRSVVTSTQSELIQDTLGT